MKLSRSRIVALAVAAAAIVPTSLVLGGASPANAAPAVVHPATGSGCTGYTVCVSVVGTGLNVSTVTGDVEPFFSSWCGYEVLRATLGSNVYVYQNSTTKCVDEGGDFKYKWTLNQSFPNQTKICVGQVTKSGTNPGGPACLIVHN